MANAEPSKKVVKTPKPPVGRTGGLKITFNSLNVKTIYHQKKDFQAQKAEKYRESLNNLQACREGELHNSILGCCNLGIKAQMAVENILDDIHRLNCHRPFKRGEVEEALSKALKEAGQSPRQSSSQPLVNKDYKAEQWGKILDNPQEAMITHQRLIERGGKHNPFGADLWERSNPRPEGLPVVAGLPGSTCRADMITLLETLYNSGDYLFIGTGLENKQQQVEHVKTAAEWISFFKSQLDAIQTEPDEKKQLCKLRYLGMNYPLFIPNPISGKPDAEGSYRSDRTVIDFRFILVESDTIKDLPEQLAILIGLKLPIVYIVYSAGKSLHAIIDAAAINGGKPIKDLKQWQFKVKDNFFGKNLSKFKIFDSSQNVYASTFDQNDKNCSRLSRLPGVWREKSGDKFQQLLYINPKGGALCLN